MNSLPKAVEPLIQELADAFTQPTYRRFVVLPLPGILVRALSASDVGVVVESYGGFHPPRPLSQPESRGGWLLPSVPGGASGRAFRQ